MGIEIKDKKGKKTFQFIPLMGICEYKEGSGYLLAQFNNFVKPYLLDLCEFFTAAQYKLFMRVNSFYSYRIYWLLKQYEDFGGKTFEVSDLKMKFNVEDKYTRYNDFKRKVLQIAKKDLANTDMSFVYDEVREGRGVKKIKFKIVGNRALPEAKEVNLSQQQIDFSVIPKKEIDKSILMLMHMGFKKLEANQIFEVIEDKHKLKKVLYRYETVCNDLSELNDDKIRQEFLDIFQLVPSQKTSN